jgi:hypothetical protein
MWNPDTKAFEAFMMKHNLDDPPFRIVPDPHGYYDVELALDDGDVVFITSLPERQRSIAIAIVESLLKELIAIPDGYINSVEMDRKESSFVAERRLTEVSNQVLAELEHMEANLPGQ